MPSRIEIGAESVRQMEISIRVAEQWAGRTLTIEDFSEDAVRRFLSEYRKTHSASTTNSKRCQLLALWRCAWEEDMLPNPPKARKIRRAKVSPAIPEAWSESEVGRILDATANIKGTVAGIPASWWWESLILAAYDTGERRKALLAVRPSDVSLSGPWIVFHSTKTKAPRWCPLSREAASACARIYDKDRKTLWPWPCSREWLDEQLRELCKAAGVRYGRVNGGLWHKIRRTCGTLVEANGGDGAKAIGNTRRVFERHYLDPRFIRDSEFHRLPRPVRSF